MTASANHLRTPSGARVLSPGPRDGGHGPAFVVPSDTMASEQEHDDHVKRPVFQNETAEDWEARLARANSGPTRRAVSPTAANAAPNVPESPASHFRVQLLSLLAALPALAGLYAISDTLLYAALGLFFVMLLVEKQGVGPDDEANSAVSVVWTVLVWLLLPVAAVVNWLG